MQYYLNRKRKETRTKTIPIKRIQHKVSNKLHYISLKKCYILFFLKNEYISISAKLLAVFFCNGDEKYGVRGELLSTIALSFSFYNEIIFVR